MYKILPIFVFIFFAFLLFSSSKGEQSNLPKQQLTDASISNFPISVIAKKEEIRVELPNSSPEIKNPKIGQILDHLNGIPVYFNGATLQSQGRHTSKAGYNYGLKWQCVEFIKRYYHDHLGHTMPDTYGHAKHFFSPQFEDGELNTFRNLFQFKNGGFFKPQVNDILVFNGKHYGHVGIISKVATNEIEIIQQNVGTKTRYKMTLGYMEGGTWRIMHKEVLGWLGKR